MGKVKRLKLEPWKLYNNILRISDKFFPLDHVLYFNLIVESIHPPGNKCAILYGMLIALYLFNEFHIQYASKYFSSHPILLFFINHKIAVLNVFYPFISIDRDQFLLITTHFGEKKTN